MICNLFFCSKHSTWAPSEQVSQKFTISRRYLIAKFETCQSAQLTTCSLGRKFLRFLLYFASNFSFRFALNMRDKFVVSIRFICHKSVADPKRFDSAPDPTFHFDSDPYSRLHDIVLGFITNSFLNLSTFQHALQDIYDTCKAYVCNLLHIFIGSTIYIFLC